MAERIQTFLDTIPLIILDGLDVNCIPLLPGENFICMNPPEYNRKSHNILSLLDEDEAQAIRNLVQELRNEYNQVLSTVSDYEKSRIDIELHKYPALLKAISDVSSLLTELLPIIERKNAEYYERNKLQITSTTTTEEKEEAREKRIALGLLEKRSVISVLQKLNNAKVKECLESFQVLIRLQDPE